MILTSALWLCACVLILHHSRACLCRASLRHLTGFPTLCLPSPPSIPSLLICALQIFTKAESMYGFFGTKHPTAGGARSSQRYLVLLLQLQFVHARRAAWLCVLGCA
jgi:hypothetical protein